MSHSAQPDPLQPALEKAQAELAKHLDEACETQTEDVSQSSAEELLRLEEELLAAARAADEAARIRRRQEQRSSGKRATGGSTSSSGTAARALSGAVTDATPAPSTPPPEPEEPGGRVREFRDRQGQAWRVWEVRPGGLGRPLRDLHRYLGPFVNGWLAFGCLDNDLRKRLPKYPPDWLQMSDSELEALMIAAADVPPRKSAQQKSG